MIAIAGYRTCEPQPATDAVDIIALRILNASEAIELL
jgi:hypothetical protein